MKKKVLLCIISILPSLAMHGQIITKSGWYCLKTPTNNVFGIPFIVPSPPKEPTIGVGDRLNLTDDDVVSQESSDFSSIYEESWKELILGSSFKNKSNISFKAEAYHPKKWFFDRKKLPNFDEESYYVVEALSADSIFIKCTIVYSEEFNSKDVEQILSKYLKANTVAFAVFDALDKNKKDSITGLLSFTKKDSSAFEIRIRSPKVFYACKYAYIKTKNPKKFTNKVRFGIDDDTTRTFSALETTENLLSGDYSEYETNIYADLILDSIKSSSPPRFYVYAIKSYTDSIALRTGKYIGDGIYEYRDQLFYKKPYGGNKFLQICICYNFKYDTKNKNIIIPGMRLYGNRWEYENCIYSYRKKLILYP